MKKQEKKEAKDFQYHVPPHNLELEESILASIMIDNDNADVFDCLAADDFYRTSHQKIFAAAAELYRGNKPTDIVAVKNQLHVSGELEAAGGAAYLADLLDNAPFASNKAHYVKLLIGKSARRKLIVLANEIGKLAYDETTGIDEVVSQIGAALNEIDSAGDTRDGYVSMSEIAIPTIERYERLAAHGSAGIKTGLDIVDEVLGGLQNDDLTIIAGRPAMGKTAFATGIAVHAAKKGLPVGVFSMEMSKNQNVDRIMSGATKINLAAFRSGGFKKSEWQEIIEAIDRVKQWPVLIDDTPGLHYQQLRRRARMMQRKQGVKLIVVDYIQLMAGDKGGNREGEVSSISRNLKALSKELHIPVVALSQLNRGLESRDNKRPRLSDLRESGSLEQDGDNILFLYRDEVYNTESKDKGLCEVIIAKQRMGPTAQVKVAWSGPTAQFKNLEVWERGE